MFFTLHWPLPPARQRFMLQSLDFARRERLHLCFGHLFKPLAPRDSRPGGDIYMQRVTYISLVTVTHTHIYNYTNYLCVLGDL